MVCTEASASPASQKLVSQISEADCRWTGHAIAQLFSSCCSKCSAKPAVGGEFLAQVKKSDRTELQAEQKEERRCSLGTWFLTFALPQAGRLD